MKCKIKLKDHCRIVFIGDSITDAKRRMPAHEPLGNGYVHFVGNMLFAKYIETVHSLAKEFSAVLVPVQSCINKKIDAVPAEKWSSDMVHPHEWAHAWIAQRWLDATNL